MRKFYSIDDKVNRNYTHTHTHSVGQEYYESGSVYSTSYASLSKIWKINVKIRSSTHYGWHLAKLLTRKYTIIACALFLRGVYFPILFSSFFSFASYSFQSKSNNTIFWKVNLISCMMYECFAIFVIFRYYSRSGLTSKTKFWRNQEGAKRRR